jgi:hypothetical protein
MSARSWIRKPCQRIPARARRAYRRLVVEALEDRLAPAMVLWTGGDGDWSVAANWTDQSDSSHHFPGASDDAVINTMVSVTHLSTGTDTIKSLTLGDIDVASNFSLSAGTLDLSGGSPSGRVQNLGSGRFMLSGGTLANATVTAHTTITESGSGGSISAVTLAGILDLRSIGGVVGVQNGLTLDGGTVQLGDAAGATAGDLTFASTESVDGDSATGHFGTIVFGSNPNNRLASTNITSNVIFGSHLTIEGTAGSINFLGGASGFAIEGQLLADPTILNTAAGTISLDAANWTNDGTIEADSGGTIRAGLGLDELVGGTLSGVLWQADNGGSILFRAGPITTNVSDVVLDGANSRLTTMDSMGTTIDALSSLTSNAGSLAIRNGATITTAGDFTNGGGLILGRSSTLTVSGNFSQTSTGELETDVGGSPASGQFGRLVVMGSAALDGTLGALFVSGTPPAPARGDVFTVLTFQDRGNSDFASFDLHAPLGLTLDHAETATSVTLTVGPPFTPGIIVTPTSGLITTQSGGTATFHVSLATVPQSGVTIPLQSDDTSAGTVPGSVTLTPADAEAGVDVTVTGVDDHMLDGDFPYRIIVGPAQSTDTGYNNLAGNDVIVTNHQTDAAGIIVTPTSGLATTKGGGQAQFSVVLSTIPSDTVRINLTSSSTLQGTPSPALVLFTPANALTPQLVTVTGQNDHRMNGNQNYSVITSAAISNDVRYNGLDPADVSLTNLATDVAIVVNPVRGLVTTDIGGMAHFTVTLSTRPTANVVIALQSSNPAEGRPTVSSLTFTPSGALSRSVMIQGQNDRMIGGPTPYTVVLEPAVSNDPRFNGMDPADVSLTNIDSVAELVITPLTNFDAADGVYQTSEAGASASFQVTLSTRPTAPVAVSLSLPNGGSEAAALSVAQLTFTPAKYLMPQTVSLTGNDDEIADENAPYSIHFSLFSGDSRSNGISMPDVQAVNLEDGPDAGIILTPLTGFVNGEFVVDESGGTANFSLALATIPAAVVTVTVTDNGSKPDQDPEVTPATLTFQPDSTALSPQVVTFTGRSTGTNHATFTINATSNDANYATNSHPNLVVLNPGAAARRVLLSNRSVSVFDQPLNLDVTVHAPDIHYLAGVFNLPYVVQVVVTNVNSFSIPRMQVASTFHYAADLRVVSLPARASYSIAATNEGPYVDIFNLPAQGTVVLSFLFPVPSSSGILANRFSVDTFGNTGNEAIKSFSNCATTSFLNGAVEWPCLAGLALLAGGPALERYLRSRRKRRAKALDPPESESS